MKAGDRYKHFKGTIYEIVAIAKHTETMEEMVIYRQADIPEKVWARPKSMFLDEVDKPAHNYKGPRFIKL